ncbi:MAG: alpha/beta hydrolase [Desulfosarcina sp.]|nr:alpha/beta hydrolase [Desulfosarcina sp.]MBC2741471.1 alpha/beta hydrolase [Desulfosarcina sp.]MBC2764385.1 alpha/beta hydrolase [Desulfosarcina sp.]
MTVVKIDGLDTYYEIHGEGETIVLLHNGFSCAMMWDGIYPLLVQAGFRVLLYDRRGFGRSDGGADFARSYVDEDFRGQSVSAMAELLARLGLDRFHIVGQCEGGVVGVDYAVRYPGQVRTLVTASTMCNSVISMEDFNRQKLPATFEGLGTDLQKKYIRWHGVDRGKIFYDICAKGGGCYGETGFFDLRPAISQVTCPLLVMYPDRGYFFDVEQGIAFYRHLTKGELLVFPKCGHNIFEHYPQMYARQIVDFIWRYRRN